MCLCVCVGAVCTATWHLSPLHCKGVGMSCMEVSTESPSKHVLPRQSCTFWVWVKEQGRVLRAILMKLGTAPLVQSC